MNLTPLNDDETKAWAVAHAGRWVTHGTHKIRLRVDGYLKTNRSVILRLEGESPGVAGWGNAGAWDVFLLPFEPAARYIYGPVEDLRLEPGGGYPHRCPRCHAPAYVGFLRVDCSAKCG